MGTVRLNIIQGLWEKKKLDGGVYTEYISNMLRAVLQCISMWPVSQETEFRCSIDIWKAQPFYLLMNLWAEGAVSLHNLSEPVVCGEVKVSVHLKLFSLHNVSSA